jgi:hypothetical protein
MRTVMLAIVLAFIAIGLKVNAQQTGRNPRINLGPMTPVSPPGTGIHHILFRASIEPSGSLLVVCGDRASSRRNAMEGFVYASYDAGRTWQETMTEASSQWSSEPSCALGSGGRTYFAAGVSNTDAGVPRHAYGHLYLYTSLDSGRTWVAPTISSFMDWTGLTVDRTQGPNRGRVYLFGHYLSDGRGEWIGAQPLLLTSDDGGRTLTEPVYPPAPSTFKRVGAYPLESVVLDDGTAISTFVGGRSEQQGKSSSASPKAYPELLRVTDGGRTVREPILLGDALLMGGVSLAID